MRWKKKMEMSLILIAWMNMKIMALSLAIVKGDQIISPKKDLLIEHIVVCTGKEMLN